LSDAESSSSEDSFEEEMRRIASPANRKHRGHADLKNALSEIEARRELNEEHKNIRSFSLEAFNKLCRNFKEHEDSPQKSYLMKSQELFTVPQPILVSHLWGVDPEINLGLRCFDEDYMKTFAETLKRGLRPGVHQINLNENRVESEAARAIFDALVQGHCQLEILNMSNNFVGLSAMPSLCNFLRMGILMDLELSNQNLQLKGGAIKVLCEGIKKQSTLHKLNVSRNNLGVVGVGAMADLVSHKNCSIVTLGMAWTELTGAEGSRFFAGLAANKSIKTLDISYNSLGGGAGGENAATNLSEAVKKNRTLEHLDISYNHFSESQCVSIGNALKKNHTIFGLHLEGNGGGGFLDSRGFYRTQKREKLGEITLGTLANILDYPNNRRCRSCWICGRWTEVEFKFNINDNNGDEEQNEGVYLCLSIDVPKFVPLRMHSKAGGNYTLKRMVPPGVLEYCFQFKRGDEFVREHCREQPTLRNLKKVALRRGNMFGMIAQASKQNLNSNPAEKKKWTPSFGETIGANNKLGVIIPAGKKKKPSKLLQKLNSVRTKLNERERAFLKEKAQESLYGNSSTSELSTESFDDLSGNHQVKKGSRNDGLRMTHSTLYPIRVEQLIVESKKPKLVDEEGVPETAADPTGNAPKKKSKKEKGGAKAKGGKKGKKGKKSKKKNEKADDKKQDLSKGGENLSLLGDRKVMDVTTDYIASQNAVIEKNERRGKKEWVLPECPVPDEKNSMLVGIGGTPFLCLKALPRKQKYGDDEDDDLAKRLGRLGGGFDLNKSTWAGRRYQNESRDFYDSVNGHNRIHRRACAADFAAGKIAELLEKLARSPADAKICKHLLFDNFVLIVNVFKAYCTKNDTPQYLTLNTFTEFCLDCEVIDHEHCSLNAVDTIFIQSNLVKKEPTMAEKNYKQVLVRNTKHLMQRYQFVVSLVRIAYAKNGGPGHQRGDLNVAIRILIEDHIESEAQRIEGGEHPTEKIRACAQNMLFGNRYCCV